MKKLTHTINRGYKFRFYPTQRQKELLKSYFGANRWVWNKALDYCSTYYSKYEESVSPIDFSRELTQLKKLEPFEWLNENPATTYGQTLRDLTSAFSKFFKDGYGYPAFKSRHDNQSVRFQLDQRIIHRLYEKGKFIKPSKAFGECRFTWSRVPKGIPKMMTLSLDKTGRYWVSFNVEEEVSVLPFTHSKVGADLGLEHALILSNGKKYENPRFLATKKAQLKRLQQRLARQVKGSNRWREIKRRIAKLHWTIGNQRRDYLHKLTTELIRDNQVIAVEDLNVKGMSSSAKGTIEQPGRMVKQKSGLNKSILDVSFGSIVAMLEYKAKFYGREVIKINRFFPSSKLCSCCGEKMESMPLKTREWTCPSCGEHHDRDVNAATNILNEALTPTGGGKHKLAA